MCLFRRQCTETCAVSPLCVILQFVFDDGHQFVSGVQSGGETGRPHRNLHVDRSRDETFGDRRGGVQQTHRHGQDHVGKALFTEPNEKGKRWILQ